MAINFTYPINKLTMRAGFSILCLFLFSTVALAQNSKINVKKDIVYANGNPQFKLVASAIPDAITLYSLLDEKLAVFNAHYYNDSKQITPGNPQGRIGYYEITFLNGDMDQCEIRMVGYKKALAEILIGEGLIEEGKLVDKSIKQFCTIQGKKFSEDRKHSGQTIIIQK